MLENVLTIVFAGAAGSNLEPLTRERAKAAIPFGGKYRIIDFPLANCLHSGLRRILVLTQYKSHSLQKHLRDGWSVFNPGLGEYVTTVPPQMRTGESWYAGTADAVYQNLYLLERSGAEHVLILRGDHIYRMDYASLLEFHRSHDAQVTVACVERDAASAPFSTLSIGKDGRITGFHAPGSGTVSASMGIYVFSMALLKELLTRDHENANSSHDFELDILPGLAPSARVMAYPFGTSAGRVSQDRYWNEISDVDAYYEANMHLLEAEPPLDLYQTDWPIWTSRGQYPPARTVPGAIGNEGIFINSIVGDGSVIAGSTVQHSILFTRVNIGDEAMVEDSVLFDGVKVGAGAQLKNCIVEKDIVIPPREKVGYDQARDRERFTLTPKGRVVIPKGYSF